MVKNTQQEAAINGGAGNAARQQKRQYKGVRMRSWGSWVSEIRAPNQKTRIWLGSYSTAEAAARAYDAALLCLKGSAADLNFPVHLPFHIPAAAMSPKSIQRVAAAAAANACSPPPLHHQHQANDGGGIYYSATTTAINATTTPPCNSSPETTDHQYGCEEMTMMARDDDDVMMMIGDDDVDLGALADIEAFFQSPKCMEYGMMDPCSTFFAPPPPMAAEWEEEGEIDLWSFSSLN
ncbi:hypothetical protein PR202_ga02872 [Eleusine coracana subsp. coracana]|uniref:AP2/ERF domain-containing protein n=1 Tax=Eleusine coracana subsp. coracana TaxID=191504 RepID=A0AAV5BMP3_ELECO|nr:hypothetical protein QOZ80_2AG0147040 [Eleusine coracana subsp. coracana]GJM86965.1 hypothetical protein PR202_ga02872 [Eleusine coracana subsp. coracana]